MDLDRYVLHHYTYFMSANVHAFTLTIYTSHNNKRNE